MRNASLYFQFLFVVVSMVKLQRKRQSAVTQIAVKLSNIGEGNEALHAFCCQLRIVAIEADEGGLRELGSHALKGETDDDGGVEAYAKFQKQQTLNAGLLYERLIAACLLMRQLSIVYRCHNPYLRIR